MRSSRVLLALACLLLVTLPFVSADYEAQRAKVGKYNARVGAKYLAEKAKEEGVTALPSGVLYRVITPGTGTVSPTTTDRVKVHYRGTLITGKEFDSSYSRGTPATFGVNGVISGWTEVLQHMTEGAVWEVHIPSEHAYGDRGSGKHIGPNATLVFKIELIEIEGKKGQVKKEDL